MRIAVASDKTGRQLARELLALLRESHLDVQSICEHDEYPDVGRYAAEYVAIGTFDRAIVICGTGTGVCMAANKVKGVFAGTCFHEEAARRLAANNNAQILCLGSDYIDVPTAKRVVKAFLETEFQPRPNAQRLRDLENSP